MASFPSTFTCRQYQLIDFGNGRKLERFGNYLVDRPCPTAEGVARRGGSGWGRADARYERAAAGGGQTWSLGERFQSPWSIQLGPLRMELRATASGQVGFFPEQIENWRWLTAQLRRRTGRTRLLNLFAYTGGSTLAAAEADAEVVHVDSARSVVTWARRNAQLSGLEDAPVRWIVDDARRFVQREIRRGNRYDGIILDPPSYGHGVKGPAWKIDRHLPDLLADCAQLIAGDRPLLLVTCHSPGWDARRLREVLGRCFPGCAAERFTARPLRLRSQRGRYLDSGAVARWPDETD